MKGILSDTVKVMLSNVMTFSSKVIAMVFLLHSPASNDHINVAIYQALMEGAVRDVSYSGPGIKVYVLSSFW